MMLDTLKLAGAGIGLFALVGGAWWMDHRGYDRATTEWSAKYDARELELNAQRFKEMDRQAAVNDAAKAAEATRVAELQADMAALNQKLKEQSRAADQDPNRDRVGLGVDSVRRIDGAGRSK